MANCKFCKWISGLWRCTRGNGMLVSDLCNTDSVDALTALDYCGDYVEANPDWDSPYPVIKV